MHLIHNDRAPVYMADSVTATANISRRTRLRSASSLRYEQPRTRLKLGERALFRLHWPGCLEQSTIIHPRTIQHRQLQTAPQNFFIQTMLFRFFIIGRFNSFYLYVTFVTRCYGHVFITVSVELYELMYQNPGFIICIIVELAALGILPATSDDRP